MSLYDVKLTGGVFCAQILGGLMPAIRDSAGRAVSEFMPGWVPESLYCGTAPVNCLNLRHSSGQRAAWYLDQNLNRIGGTFREITEEHQPAFGKLADHFESAIRSRILCCHDVGQSSIDLIRINAPARHDITEYLLDGRLRNRTIVLQTMDPGVAPAELDALGNPGGHVEVAKHLRDLLKADFKDQITQSIPSGSLMLPSPINGDVQRCAATLLLTDRAIAYRFIDSSGGLPYYVLGADWRHGICAVYFPTLWLTVYGTDNQRADAENSLGGELHKVIFRHASAQAENLEHYSAPPQEKLALLYSYWHLGHHLWNELSGLDHLLKQIPSERLPRVYLLQAAKTEMYGRLDDLFPELRGRVDRTLSSLDELRQVIYRGNNLCVRLNDTRVSRAVASRIINLSKVAAVRRQEAVELEKLIHDGYELVLLGLRVENRTLADLPQFCRDLIAFLRLEMGKVAIVLDGHNRPEGSDAAYISHREAAATQSPIEVERHLVSSLIAEFAHQPNIRIINTVGQPMSTSIFWSDHCRFFVTPWGAGLAKYRWVCNRPGLVLAGWMFQAPEYRQTLHLYDDASCMESPAPICFIDRSAVADVSDSALLIPDPSDVTRVNFRVDREALWVQLRDVIHPSRLA